MICIKKKFFFTLLRKICIVLGLKGKLVRNVLVLDYVKFRKAHSAT